MPSYPYAYDLTPDGVATTFALPAQPDPQSLLVLWNGLVQRSNYTLTGSTLILTWTPAASDSLCVYFTSATVPPGPSVVGPSVFNPEAIAIALFTLLGQANYPFASMDRRGQLPENVPSANQPYLGLVELGMAQAINRAALNDQAQGLEKWLLHFRVLVYLRTDATPQTIPASALNAALLAIVQVLRASPLGTRQTLGGIVDDCFIFGDVMMDTAILDQQAAMMIPVAVDCGM